MLRRLIPKSMILPTGRLVAPASVRVSLSSPNDRPLFTVHFPFKTRNWRSIGSLVRFANARQVSGVTRVSGGCFGGVKAIHELRQELLRRTFVFDSFFRLRSV